MKRLSKLALCLMSVVFVVGWVVPSKSSDNPLYQTTQGTGPDKWASVWLIRQFLNATPVSIKSTEAEFHADFIGFDTDNSALTRTGTSTTYTALLDAHGISDPVAAKLGKIIHDIEINAWNPNREIESLQIENGFRQMQLAFGRDKVTQTCYMMFFSSVADAIKRANITLETDASQFIPPERCLQESDSTIAELSNGPSNTQVPELELNAVLDSLVRNKNVVFVDTREAFEFREGHIPGAVNLTLRKINSMVKGSASPGPIMQQLIDADLVIAYCVKDFRGFEAARSLRKRGVNAAIMNPYGIKGWRNAKLPVTGTRGLSESDATAAMQSLLIKHKDGQHENS